MLSCSGKAVIARTLMNRVSAFSRIDPCLVAVRGLLDPQGWLHLGEDPSNDLADVGLVVDDEDRARPRRPLEERLVDRNVVLVEERPEVLGTHTVVPAGGREGPQLAGLDPFQNAVVRDRTVACDLRRGEETTTVLLFGPHTVHTSLTIFRFFHAVGSGI
jgi:hypothetical protein